MSQLEHAVPRRGVPLAIAFAGAFALLASTAFGPSAIPFGAVAFVIACLVALRDATAPVFTWSNVLVLLIAVIWLIPIKLYSLPIHLPFNLEVYRLFLLLLIFAWVIAGINGRARVNAAGHGKPLLLLAVSTIATQISYVRGIQSDVLQTEALKAMSYFLSFLLLFLLISSVIRSVAQADKLVRALVIGGALVGATALYEARTQHNVFSQLDQWLPLDREPREVFEERGGRLRVYASAQHPIALGCALIMMLPLSIYLAQTALSSLLRRFWLVAALVIGAAAMTTISRTTVVMLITMAVVGLRLRPRMLARNWPLLIVLPFLVHFMAPGALGGLYKSFFPKEGLVSSLNDRAGESGSGRFADVGPGLDLWAESPIVGHGLGSQLSTGSSEPTATPSGGPQARQAGIIFDDQYLNTIVSAGLLGIVGAVWFIWGAAIKLGRAAKRTQGREGELLAACSVSCAGFAASMFLFDAFSFVQATLVFFIIAALGLRLRALTQLRMAS